MQADINENIHILESLPEAKGQDPKETPKAEPPKLPAAENIHDLRKRVQEDIVKEENEKKKSELTTIDAKGPEAFDKMDPD